MRTVSGIGGSLLRVRPAQITDIEIFLPPLPEQQRIAKLLEQSDHLRRIRHHALELSDAFLPAAFVELFGSLSANDRGWRVVPFKNVCAIDAPLVDPRKTQYRSLPHIGGDSIESVTGRLLNYRTAAEDGLGRRRWANKRKVSDWLRTCFVFQNPPKATQSLNSQHGCALQC